MSTLYEITGQIKELLLIAELEELDEQTLKDTMESLEYELEDKADGYAKVIRELEGQAETLKSEIDRLTKRRNGIEANISLMKEALKNAMKETGKTKFKTDLFSFTVAKNGGKQPLDIHGDVLEAYKKIEYKVDNDKIREELKDGKELPFAKLKERGDHLRVR